MKYTNTLLDNECDDKQNDIVVVSYSSFIKNKYEAGENDSLFVNGKGNTLASHPPFSSFTIPFKNKYEFVLGNPSGDDKGIFFYISFHPPFYSPALSLLGYNDLVGCTLDTSLFLTPPVRTRWHFCGCVLPSLLWWWCLIER